jgi:hypothetical protein
MKTMAVWLECPVCEYRFSVPEDFSNKAGKCPKCENVFNAADCQLPEKTAISDEDELEIPQPVALSQIDSGTGSLNVQPDVIVDKNVSKSYRKRSKSGKGVETLDTDMPFVPANKKKTDPNKVLLLIIGTCVVALMLLIGIPIIATTFFSGGEEKKNETAAKSKASGIVEKQENKSDAKEDLSKTKSGKRGGKKGSGAKGDGASGGNAPKLNSTEFAAIWSSISSNFVLVVAKRNSGNVTSHGVVISNDGAIAVNWSQIKGADSVRVKFPSKVYNASERWGKPIQARKLIGKSEALNVAIIHINQVTSPIKARPENAEAGRGVIPILTNLKSSEYLRQTRIRSAAAFADLSADEKAVIAGVGLVPDATTPIMIHTGTINKTGLGVPVFDEAGRFAGMHFANDAKNKTSYGLPLSVLSDIASDPSNRVTSITPGDSPKQGDKDLNFREALDLMSRSEWSMTEATFFPNAQKFSMSWSALNQEYLAADFTRKNEIDELKKENRDVQRQLLIWPTDAVQSDINRLAVAALESKSKIGWFGLVKVIQPRGIAPVIGEESSMLVELLGTSQRALLLSGDVEGPFVQGTQWMVFGISNNRIVRAGGEKYPVLQIVGVKKR